MWLRRISSAGAMHLPGFSITMFGVGVRAGRVSSSWPKTGADETAHSTVKNTSRLRNDFTACLLAEAHLDVAGRTDVGANVTADALVVVGGDIAAGHGLGFLDLV